MAKPIDAKTVMSDIKMLPDSEIRLIYNGVYEMLNPAVPIDESISNAKKNRGYACPDCGGRAVKNGRNASGHQTYRCTKCGKRFTSLTGTFMQGTRKDAGTWRIFLDGLLNSHTLEDIAKASGISVTTAFYWRQKVFDALLELNGDVSLSGVIEADETFILDDFKGNHKKFVLPRPARRHISKAAVAGLSKCQVCVPCMMDSNGNAKALITNTGKIDAKTLDAAFGDAVVPGSIMCSDAATVYRRFSASRSITLYQIPPKKHKSGPYDIQKINALHHDLKDLLEKDTRGVASKYANGYIAFACWKATHDGPDSEVVSQLIADIAKGTSVKITKKISDRAALPTIT
ncbi:MAG: IS1595 family transposase [Lachnospiraceae bacterium]|nr:IS1595 family transposase [Lachnospiraceae bacterium]MCI1727008.1 IS1595 family transposase [Lachnospiraceae bacterium]